MSKWLTVFMVMFFILGCGGGSEEAAQTGEPATETQGAAVEAPKSTAERPIVVLDTDSGSMVMEFYPDVAPITCDSILSLVNQGFYNGLTFHRIIPGFVIQGGDPKGNGTGNAGFQIPAEFSDRSHVEGAVSMARNPVDINSSSCQFFICLADRPELDGQYNLFGKVISGMDVAHKLEKVPTGARNKPLEPLIIRRMYENK